MPNINKIKLSGTSYDIQDSNATKTVTLTQAEYDALQTKDPNTFYIISDGETFDPSEKVDTSAFTAYSASVETALSGKAAQSDLNTLSGTVTGHTADTTIHVTSSDKATWNAKSDFSGNYNDLSNKPTIPSKTSDLTNDSDFATTGDVQTATNDMATKTWVGQQGYLTQHQDISGKQDVSGMTAYTETSAFTAHTADTTVHVTSAEKSTWNNKSDFSGDYNDLTNKLSAGTNITIVDNVISAEGGGKAVSGGTNISVTTGETADTINCTLSGGTLINISNNKINCSAPIRYGTGNNSVIVGSSISTNKATGMNSIANGGDANTASGQYSFAEGFNTQATKHSSHSEGWFTQASGNYSHAEGNHTKATNESEHASGKYNVSSSASTTFGDSGNTLFSVGNGTADNARHNAFEIRQNGDIYLTLDGQDVKLQDQLGGGGGSSVVELTQAQYDALTTIDPDTIYVITDAAGGDLSNYYTKAQINAMIGDIESLLAAI